MYGPNCCAQLPRAPPPAPTLHVVTAIADPYVSIGWWATIIPFVSHYKAAALGLGTLAVDFGAAVILTSLFRHRLGFKAWRSVHWLAYLAWPVAFVHSLRAGNDLGIAWVYAVEWGSAASRATGGHRPHFLPNRAPPPRGRAGR